MYGGSGALDLAEEPEGEDAQGQTDEGDDHPQLGDPGQDGIVGCQLGSKWKGRCFIRSFMVCWSCNLLHFLLGIASYNIDVDRGYPNMPACRHIGFILVLKYQKHALLNYSFEFKCPDFA